MSNSPMVPLAIKGEPTMRPHFTLLCLILGVRCASGSLPQQFDADKPDRRYVANQERRFSHLIHRLLTGSNSGEAWITEEHSEYWAEGKGGNGENLYKVVQTGYDSSEFLQEFDWPPTSWPTLTNATVVNTPWNGDGRFIAGGPPLIDMTYCDIPHNSFDVHYPEDWIHTECTWHTETKLSLDTGGKALPHRQNLFFLSGAATEVIEKATPPVYSSTSYREITNKTEIEIGNLGPLGSDGRLYVALPDDATQDVTPRVRSKNYYAFNIAHTKQKLVHLTQCTALTNPNNERTTIGVGEYVNFAFEPPVDMTFPEIPWWIASEGSIDPATGSGTLFTAPSNAANAMVRVFVRDAQLDTFFSVKEPMGYAKPPTHLASTVPMDPSETQAGAGMKNWVYIAPTDVSFCRIQVKEANGPASTNWGCYTNSVLNTYHYNNTWYNVNENNVWCSVPDKAEGKIDIARMPPPGEWVPGGFTWHIPVYWTIGAQDGFRDIDPELPLTFMTHWDQEHKVDNAGKYTVIKFDATVSRTLDNYYETSETPNPNQ
jgi:hypothetical protein